MLGVNVQEDTKISQQIQDIYKESNKYTDQSVRQTLTQAYAVDLANHTEDITEMKKNFVNNINAKAESSQKNITEFQACMELSDFNAEQTNTLVQDVVQGFDQLEQEAKELKRAIETNSDTTITAAQGSDSKQDGHQASDQGTTADQTTQQESEQKQEEFKAFRYKRFNENKLGVVQSYRDYMRERSEKLHTYRKKLTVEKMKASTMTPVRNFGRFVERYLRKSHVPKRIRESFPCLFGCADVQTSYEYSSEIMRDTQISNETLIQSQDIYESINTAYNKTIETIVKIYEEVEKKNDTESKAVSSQVNIISIKTPEDACMMKLKNINIKQSNQLSQNVALTVALESISNMTSDVVVKAIMSDMMGLTQTAAADQSSKQVAVQNSQLKQATAQVTKQGQSSSGGIVSIIIIVIICLMLFGPMLGFGTGGGSYDTYFDAPSVKNTGNTGMNQDMDMDGIPDAVDADGGTGMY